MRGIKEGDKQEKQDVGTLLDEREKRYGQFKAHTEISQGIKLCMHQAPQWNALKPHQKESLDMIAHKIARILNGDPDYIDNWRDLSAYSQLVVNILLKTDGVTDSRVVMQQVVNGMLQDSQ